jgi:Uncharacterised nucleotidyltransferase
MTELAAGLRAEAALLVCCARVAMDPASAARLGELVAGSLDWTRVLALGTSQAMLPLLHRHLAPLAVGVPGDVRAELEARAQENLRHSLLLTGELLCLDAAFEAAGIPAVSFKGPTLAVSAYGTLALRRSLDLDILVPWEHLPRATAVLARHGYRDPLTPLTRVRRAFSLRFAHELAFQRADRRVLVDLHWEIQTRLLAVPFDTMRLVRGGGRVVVAGRAVRTLSPDDLVLVLCAHGSHHRWDRLAWICDVAELIRRHPELGWTDIAAQARRLGIDRMLRLGLFLAGELLGAPVPASLAETARRDRTVRSLAGSVLDRLDAGAAAGPSEGLEEVAFYLRARERLRDRARYVFRATTIPTYHEVTAVALPPPLAFLYYPMRPLRLASKYGRDLWRRRRPRFAGRT